MRLRRTMWACLAAVLVLGGCGRDEEGGGGSGDSTKADPGITKTEIKLGGSYPFSGPSGRSTRATRVC